MPGTTQRPKPTRVSIRAEVLQDSWLWPVTTIVPALPQITEEVVQVMGSTMEDEQVPLPIFTRKVQQSILATPCTAGSRPDARPVKDHLQAKKGSEKLLNKPKAGLTLEQQATLLLMKNSGVGGGPVQSDSEIVAQFPEQFHCVRREAALQ